MYVNLIVFDHLQSIIQVQLWCNCENGGTIVIHRLSCFNSKCSLRNIFFVEYLRNTLHRGINFCVWLLFCILGKCNVWYPCAGYYGVKPFWLLKESKSEDWVCVIACIQLVVMVASISSGRPGKKGFNNRDCGRQLVVRPGLTFVMLLVGHHTVTWVCLKEKVWLMNEVK